VIERAAMLEASTAFSRPFCAKVDQVSLERVQFLPGIGRYWYLLVYISTNCRFNPGA